MTRLLPLLLATLALAHGDHSLGHGEDDPNAGYAERHMRTEHHIDNFDLAAFFKLHDLDSNGSWDRDEVAAIYGLRHHSVLNRKPEHKIPDGLEDKIVNAVFEKLDKNGDGWITQEEFVSAGANSLPVFPEHAHLGHHYDEESEYFLHHEELYHNTPETQTDESYNHPEDIEHFKHHGHIESEEDARQRIFEGLPANADLGKEHAAPVDPLDSHAHAEGDGPDALADNGQVIEDRAERAARAARRNLPARLQDPPSDPARARNRHSHQERIRADAPYKYKMRAGIRADEF